MNAINPQQALIFTGMNEAPYVFLADDDEDDRLLFEEVLHDVAPNAHLTIATDGVALMQLLLQQHAPAPDVIFLDLNMPRKNGLACLAEIRQEAHLRLVDVIIFSTSVNTEMVAATERSGASMYIQKPSDYEAMRRLIYRCLTGLSELRRESGYLLTAA